MKQFTAMCENITSISRILHLLLYYSKIYWYHKVKTDRPVNKIPLKGGK